MEMETMLQVLQLQLHDRLDIGQKVSCGSFVVSCGFQADRFYLV